MNRHRKTAWRLLPSSLLIVLALALGLFANQPAFSAALSEIATPTPTDEPDGSFACVENWAGTGSNRAAVAIDWNDGKKPGNIGVGLSLERLGHRRGYAHRRGPG